jgi:hypothetical protein
VLLRIRPVDEAFDERRLRRLLRAIVPAHLAIDVEVLDAGSEA